MPSPHPHGSAVEQVHRVLTTNQGVDPWALAEEIVKFVQDEALARRTPFIEQAFLAQLDELGLSGQAPYEPDCESQR